MATVEHPPRRPQRLPVLALCGAVTQLEAQGRFGTTRASLVATPRFVFVVPHRATVVPMATSSHWLPREEAVGPSEEQLTETLEGMLSSPHGDMAQAESLARVASAGRTGARARRSAGLRGRDYKRRGAFTWDGVDLAPAAAQQLLAYLPSPADAKAANPEVANRRVDEHRRLGSNQRRPGPEPGVLPLNYSDERRPPAGLRAGDPPVRATV
jgi:hypothetical protein